RRHTRCYRDWSSDVCSSDLIWRAFENNYWPALYLADAQGRIRAHHFGEGAYDMSEMILQQLLADAGFSGFGDDLVTVQSEGPERSEERRVGKEWRDGGGEVC